MSQRWGEKEANRWLKQAHYDFQVAERLLVQGIYSYGRFLCQQATQKALKVHLYFEGKRCAWQHSIQGLAGVSRQYDDRFENTIEAAKILDRYHTPTRYPDPLAPQAVPYRTHIKKDASQSGSPAQRTTKTVKQEIETGTWTQHRSWFLP